MSNSTSTKKVVVNSIIYSFSGIMLKCFSFFLLPLYTVYLTTDDYGITSIATSFIGTMTFIVSLSLYSAIMRFYVDLKDNPEKLKKFYGTVAIFTLISGIGWFSLITIFRGFVSKYIFSGIDYYPVIVVCLFSLVFTCQATIYDDILKSQQKALKSSILTAIIFFITLGLNILFIVVMKMGAVGSLLSTLISQLVYTLLFWFDMLRHKQIICCIDLNLLKEALRYSIPIIPHNLATRMAVLISKVLIGDAASLASVGIYAVASQFGDIADTFQGYVDKAYQPWLYEKLKEANEGYKDSIRSTVKMLIAVLGLLSICIAIFAQDYIVLFVNSAYVDAWKYIPLIVLVFSIKTIYYFYVEVLFYHKKASKLIFIATLTSSLINIVFSYFLIAKYRIVGSIIADAIAMLIRVAIVVSFSLNFENIGLKVRDFIANFFTIAFFIAVGLLLSIIKYQYTFSFINLGYKMLVVGIYVVLLYLRYKRQIIPLVNNLIRHKQ